MRGCLLTEESILFFYPFLPFLQADGPPRLRHRRPLPHSRCGRQASYGPAGAQTVGMRRGGTELPISSDPGRGRAAVWWVGVSCMQTDQTKCPRRRARRSSPAAPEHSTHRQYSTLANSTRKTKTKLANSVDFFWKHVVRDRKKIARRCYIF